MRLSIGTKMRMSIGTKMMTAFGSIIIVIAVVIWAGFNGLDSVADTYENEVLRIAETMMLSERTEKHFHALATAFSGYLVTRNPSYISDFRTASQEGAATIAQIRQLAQSEEANEIIDRVEQVQQEYTQQVESLFQSFEGVDSPLFQGISSASTIIMSTVERSHTAMFQAVQDLLDYQARRMDEVRSAAEEARSRASLLMMIVAAIAVVIAVGFASIVSRRPPALCVRSPRPPSA